MCPLRLPDGFPVVHPRGQTRSHGSERKPAKENARRKQRGQQRLITLDRSRLLKRHLTQSTHPVKRLWNARGLKYPVFSGETTGITGIFDISLRAGIPMKMMKAYTLFPW
jgi:hypothetical protein